MRKLTLLLMTLCLNVLGMQAQEITCPDSIQERARKVVAEFGAVPLIICNEKEMSLDEFASLDLSRYGTCVFFHIKDIAVELAGEREKDGLIYVHDKKNYFPFPDSFHGGYFMGGDFPAEFTEGADSMYKYIASYQRISKIVLESGLQGQTEVLCYISEDGAVDSCEVLCVEIMEPCHLDIYPVNGEILPTDILGKRTFKVIKEIADSAIEVTNSLPSFKPAMFYLRPSKYKKRIYIPFRYDNGLKEGSMSTQRDAPGIGEKMYD